MFLKNIFKTTVLLCVGLFLFSPWGVAEAQSADQFVWQTIETKHTFIYYQNNDDLKEFDDQIDFSPEEGGLIKSLFSSSDPKTLPEKLARKIDELFEKVQEILGMRKKMRKVRINLYSNSEQLGIAYQRLFKKDCGVRSWYLYEFKTIYCNVSDLRAGMLAHEMAHHIIDHYLVIRPPRSTAEILARYVDKHLNDSVKRY